MFTPQGHSSDKFASEESVASIPSEFSFERRNSIIPDPRLSKSISDKDLVKELLNENYQLKSTISEQQKLIEELQSKLKSANHRLPKEDQINSNSSLKLNIKGTDSLVIPERSHRRKISVENSPSISENSIDTSGNVTNSNSTNSLGYNNNGSNSGSQLATLIKNEELKQSKSPITRENSNYSVSSAARSSIYSNDSFTQVQRPPSSPYRARIRIPTSKPSSPSMTSAQEEPPTNSTVIINSAQSVSISRPVSPPTMRHVSSKRQSINLDEGLSPTLSNNSGNLGGIDPEFSNSSSSIATASIPTNPLNYKNLTINAAHSSQSTLSNDNQYLESPAIVQRDNLASNNIHNNNNGAIALQTPREQMTARFVQSSPSSRNVTPQHTRSTSQNIAGLASPLQTANTFTSPMPSSYQPSPAPTRPDVTPMANHENLQSPTFSRQNKVEDDVPLFIKPEDFHTIIIDVESTISSFMLKRYDEPTVVIVVRDRNTRKEMWRIKKTFLQISRFDSYIRPVVDSFSLPPMPEKQLFYSTSPMKVDARRVSLQDYFNTLFVITHIPQLVLYKICRFLSLNFINPLDDYKSGARKEGFLIRRSKGLGNNWKVRWCQVEGSSLEVYEQPGGSLVETIKLTGSQIGRQSTNDTVADEKGYKHAFLIMELRRSSSYTKHIFCCETDTERDAWIDTLIESINADPNPPRRKNSTTSNVSKNSNDEVFAPQPVPKASTNIIPQSPRDIMTPFNDDNGRGKKRSFFPFRAKTFSNDEIDPSKADDQVSATQNILDELNLEDARDAVFGREIEEVYELSHRECYGKEIPSVAARCIEFLLKTGAIYEEGIFRLSGSATMIKHLKEQFDNEFDVDLVGLVPCPDIHTVAGLLKLYLREIPSPILSPKTYPIFKQVISSAKTPREVALKFEELIKEIPEPNYNICFAIFKFLNEIIDNNKSNLMNLRNVCIVFSPTLNIAVSVLSPLIVDYECIFNGKDPIDDSKREILDIKIPGF